MQIRYLAIAPAIAIALAMAFSAPAMAQPLPPNNALPLSRVLANIERSHNVRAFVDVDWDDDGYWEVEYLPRDGSRKVKLRIDPVTGGSFQRGVQRGRSRYRN